MSHLSEDTILMCQECRQRSGYGLPIEVVYTTSNGGWSPAWEGRVCLYVTREQILEHFGLENRDGNISRRSA
jgi:hypothetical protein